MMRAIGHLEGGARQIDVARELGTTQSVISRLLARYRDHGDVSERHTGRTRATTSRQDRFLELTARRESNITAPELQIRLQRAYQVSVSADTVRRRLHEANLRSRRPVRVVNLSRGNREARYSWAQQHVGWSNDDWANVLFSDESRFGIYPDSRRTRVWREPGNRARLNNLQPTHSYQGGTIMVWGGISLGGRTDLVFLERFMTGALYLDVILQPIVVPYAATQGPSFILMHDNARPHTSRAVRNFLEESNIRVLQWPSQSPDLNPIEHAWDMLQRRVLSIGAPRDNRRNLFSALSEAWRAIPQEDLDNLILSMPRRCQAVLNERGGQTLY